MKWKNRFFSLIEKKFINFVILTHNDTITLHRKMQSKLVTSLFHTEY